jgi:hypothetical protein
VVRQMSKRTIHRRQMQLQTLCQHATSQQSIHTKTNYYAGFCFLDDTTAINDFVVGMWMEQLEGKGHGQGMAIVSVMTEFALELIFKLAEEMGQKVGDKGERISGSHPTLAVWVTILNTLYGSRSAMETTPQFPVPVKPLAEPQPFPKPTAPIIAVDTLLIEYVIELRIEAVSC